jgi:NAD(P)-dependent dehydrogenase (short-subunit alcohol dehydrogenase family)
MSGTMLAITTPERKTRSRENRREHHGKRVIITGESGGIGLALAQVLLAKGAKVAINGRRPEVVTEAVRSLQTRSAEVHGIVADAATAQGRAATLVHTLAALGRVDILVNNAGGVRVGRLESITEAELRAMIDVNLVAPFSSREPPSRRCVGAGRRWW